MKRLALSFYWKTTFFRLPTDLCRSFSSSFSPGLVDREIIPPGYGASSPSSTFSLHSSLATQSQNTYTLTSWPVNLHMWNRWSFAFGTIRTPRLWNNCITSLEQLYHIFGTTVQRLWNNCITSLEQLWPTKFSAPTSLSQSVVVTTHSYILFPWQRVYR